MTYLKIGAAIAIAVAAYLGLQYVYQTIYDRGVASQQSKIEQLTGERDEARNLLKAARQTQKNQDEAHSRAVADLQRQTANDLAALQLRLDKAERLAQTRKETIKYVKEYVTIKGDAGCIVPAGFVRFHDLHAQTGTAAAGPTESPALPGSGPADADGPSGIALSEVAAVVADNYDECDARGQVIKEWQTWYKNSKTSYEQAVREQQNFRQVIPLQ